MYLFYEFINFPQWQLAAHTAKPLMSPLSEPFSIQHLY